MAKLAEVYLDGVGMASLLLTNMGRKAGVVAAAHWHWTFTISLLLAGYVVFFQRIDFIF